VAARRPDRSEAPAATSRLYIASWPDAATRAAVVGWRDANRWPAGTRAVAPALLHLTLHFLGPVPDSRLPALVAALAGVDAEPCVLRLDRFERWPHGLGVLASALPVPAALAARHAALGRALASLGRPLDARPYRPHVTVLRRLPAASDAATETCSAPHVVWPVREHVLVRSDRGVHLVLSAPGAAADRA
jgi:2'-5' RNA ligase